MKYSPISRYSAHAATALVAVFLAAFLAASCATTAPAELVHARAAYARASAGPAAQATPADLHKAKTALDHAEANFAAGKDRATTVDLAYIAERTAQIAEARAETAIAQKQTATAKQAFGDKQAAIAKQAEGDLVKTREQLSQAEQGQAQQARQTEAERSARQESDRKAAASELKAQEANAALAKLAAKEEERGMVITLSGSVLFRSNDSTLLPAAQTRLDQVAEALVAKGNDVVVEGYTDSKGSQATNMNLSQRRAESVRGYLVSRGFSAAKIVARGMGPDRPIADNSSAEGRANNRRVEIVVAKNSMRTN